MKCETCGKNHSGKYGSGRFCSAKCARAFSSKHVSAEGRKKQKEALTNKDNLRKSFETRMINNENYELGDDGTWKRIKKPKKQTKQYENQYKHSMMLGKIGEIATAKKFMEHGYTVFVPLVDIDGTDMIVEKDDGLKKIQVKSSSISSSDEHRDTSFSLTGTRNHIKNGSVSSYNKKYNKNSADYFALYSVHDQDIYLIENDEKRKSITIRTSLSDDNLTTKGKNLEKLHMAEDYQIDKVLDDIDMGIDRNNIIEVSDFTDNSDN